MAVIKLVVYNDNATVDKIDMILSRSGTKHFVKNGEDENSKYDVIVFDNNTGIIEQIKDKFKNIEMAYVDIDIDSCDVSDFPLPNVIPDNPDVFNRNYKKIIGICVFVTVFVAAFFLI